MYRAAALLAALLLLVALGPWVLPLLLGLLALRRVRAWLLPSWSWRGAGIVASAGLVLAALVVVLPDGWLPVPQGPGRLVTPSYVGRPALVRPVTGGVLPQHPQLAEGGAEVVGPVGDQPLVDSGWYGREGCRSVAVDSRGRLVAWCGEPDQPLLRVVDPGTLSPLASRELPSGADGVAQEAAASCAGAFLLDARDRAVVATGDEVVVLDTADGEGEPDLTVAERHDLSDLVAEGDCVVGLVPDWGGNLWFASASGIVGVVDGESGRVRSTDLGERVGNGLAADQQGGVYVVTDGALYRMLADAAGRPRTLWRSQYDAGSERKDGQLARGSGTAPTVLPGGTVAIVDNAEPRPHVVLLDQQDGEQVCEAAVFEDDAGATEAALTVVAADAVVVVNHHGLDGLLGSVLGFTSTPGLARVEVADGECRVRWTNTDLVVPGTVPAVSLPNGLLYAATKRPSLWGVSAWYLSAVDVHTGRHVFSVRTGTGPLMDHRGSAVTLAPDGSAYVATRAGLVRVRDRVRE